MYYVIFGAGEWGRYALDFLGHPRVKCFVDNYNDGTQCINNDVMDF